jgi:hypothetical protein
MTATSAAARQEPWWEIPGVVEDFPGPADRASLRLKAYRPLQPTEAYALTLAVRARGLTPAAVADRIRTVALSVIGVPAAGVLGRLDGDSASLGTHVVRLLQVAAMMAVSSRRSARRAEHCECSQRRQ